MILSPAEQRALDDIGSGLRAAEPRLAAKFAIFTRLTAPEGSPPDEDLITAVARRPGTPAPAFPVRAIPAAARSRWQRGHRRRRGQRRARVLRRSQSAIMIPAAMLLLMILIITVSMSRVTRCPAPALARGTALTGDVAVSAGCRPGGTARARPAPGDRTGWTAGAKPGEIGSSPGIRRPGDSVPIERVAAAS